MKKIIFLSSFLITVLVFGQKPIFVTAKVKSATVYFNAAEISQNASVLLPKGTSEIVLKNVSNYVNESSVQIAAPGSVTVLSVQFSNNYISEYELDESNPAIKKVRDSINLVQKEIKKVQNTRDSEANAMGLLDKNQQISGLNSGLNVAELMKMVDYYKLKRTELNNNYDALEEKSIKLTQLLAKLNSKLEINTKKEEKSSEGKLILQVMNEVAGNVNFEINYLTNNASWKPFYDLRVESITDPMSIMYKAEVKQETGLDWKNIKLSLSSGNPNQNNQAPTVNPWFLQYSMPIAMYDNAVVNEVTVMAYGKQKKTELAGSVRSISNYTAINENQLNISFDIDIPYDVLSNGKAHSVSLKEIKIPASFNYFGAPKAEKEAFLMAEIVDYSKYNLLNGEANIIFEGMYVGKTQINTNQVSDTLRLSMGRDKKIAIKREKVAEKSGTKFLSSKKEQTFTYDITVRNNKKEAVEINLKDQYPLSTDKEIEIELTEKDGANVNVETGILSWNLKLKPAETKKIRISYTVKSPKDKTISNLN